MYFKSFYFSHHAVYQKCGLFSWPIHVFSELAFHFPKAREMQSPISLCFDSKISEVLQCQGKQFLLPISSALLPPRKILSPPKQLLKIHFFLFSVNCSLETWRCVGRISLSLFLIPKFPFGSQRTLPSLPGWTLLKVGTDLATWQR